MGYKLFTDNSWFGFCPDSRRVRVCRWFRNVKRLTHVQEVFKYRGSTVILWGGITLGGRPNLVFANRFLTALHYLDTTYQGTADMKLSFVHLLVRMAKVSIQCVIMMVCMLHELCQTGWPPRELTYCHDQHYTLTSILWSMNGTCFKQGLLHIWVTFRMRFVYGSF